MLEKIYRSIYYYLTQVAPSGVDVVEGEYYGVRMDDPAAKNPALTFKLGDLEDDNTGLELGSPGVSIPVFILCVGKSRRQRDALRDRVFDSIRNGTTAELVLYRQFNNLVPLPESGIYMYDIEYLSTTGIENFNSQNEQYFWTANVVLNLNIVG